MRMKHYSFKILALFLIFGTACLLGMIACDKKAAEKPFKVAMLLPGSASDAGWNALAFEGLKAIEKELGAQISHIESRTPADQEDHFRSYAQNGYSLVFGHGYEYQDPAKAVAPDFPGTVFVTSSGSTILKNVAPIVFEMEEATYLLGVIAGMMTQTGKVGVVGGTNIPSINSTFMAFEGGVKATNPDAEVRRAYVGDWDNIGKAKEIALAQINEGIDFIFHNANAAGRGVFEAMENARQSGKDVYCFGSNRDQSHVSPTTILANAVISLDCFVRVARSVKDGTFEAKTLNMTMSNDEAIKIVYNPELANKIPEQVTKKVEEVKSQILAKQVKVPRIHFGVDDL